MRQLNYGKMQQLRQKNKYHIR